MKGGWWGETLRPFAEVSCSWDTLGQECPCHCWCPSRVCPGLHSVWSLILLLYMLNTHQVDMEFGWWVFFQPTVIGLWLVFDNFIIVIYHITRNRWSNRIVSRISYSNHLADSMFLKFKCEVNSEFFFFPEQLFLVHYLGHWFCAVYYLMNVWWKVITVTICCFYRSCKST